MWAELSESERWRDLPKEGDHVHVLDPALGIRVVLTPEPDKLVEMVRTENGPIPGQVVEVVHDDSDKEIENEEGADDEEGDEIGIGEIRSATRRIT